MYHMTCICAIYIYSVILHVTVLSIKKKNITCFEEWLVYFVFSHSVSVLFHIMYM